MSSSAAAIGVRASCRWCLGADLVAASAQSGTFREENPNENTTMALLSFSDGTMVSFWSSSVCPAPVFSGEEFRFRIMGDEGIIDHDPYARVQLGKGGEWTTVFEQPPVGHTDANSAFSMNRMQAYCDQGQAFVNSIHGHPSGEGTPADGRAGRQRFGASLNGWTPNQGVPAPAGNSELL